MAENQYVNKVVFGNTTVMDISDTTADPTKVLASEKFYDRSGAPQTGACTFDADASDADATAAEILLNKTAYVNGNKLTGTMPNRGAVTGTISTVAGTYGIQNGYHDGSGTVGIDSTEQAKIVAGNIKKDVTILGVTGTYEGSATPTSTAKTVTPYTTSKTYLPSGESTPVDYYSQVTVNAISYVETDNAAGGKTCTIGDVAPV
jgi:hypothetical protein